MNRLFQKLQRNYQKRRVGGGGGGSSSQHTKLMIDHTTCAVLKLEIQQLLRVYHHNNNNNNNSSSSNNTLTPLSMVNALMGSKHLLNVYAEGNDNDDGFFVGTTHKKDDFPSATPLVRRWSGAWSGRAPADSSTQRRYDFMNTLNQLQQYVSSSNHNIEIAQWDDAMKILSMVFRFPWEYNDDDDDDNYYNNNDDQNNHRPIMTTTTTAVMAIPDSSVETVPTTATPWTHHPSVVVDDTTRTEIFLQRLRDIRIEEMSPPGLRPSQLQWLQVAVTAAVGPSPDVDNNATSPSLPLFRDLTDAERAILATTMTPGRDTDIVARTIDDTDSVQRMNLRTLEPYEWVNDEVIHFYLYLLQQRDEQQQSSILQKRTHFFKSFFMTKLLDEGNSNPALDGVYNYNNVKRWSKKVPGKDIFNLSKIVFPINQGNQHWTSAVIYMEEQRIQYYDSLGGSGKRYLQVLHQYLQDEHLDKKKTPMKCPELWTLVPCTDDTPRQQNGYDCGVFTCLFADFLSANRSFEGFQPSDMTLYRQHIALSIIKGEIVS